MGADITFCFNNEKASEQVMFQSRMLECLWVWLVGGTSISVKCGMKRQKNFNRPMND